MPVLDYSKDSTGPEGPDPPRYSAIAVGAMAVGALLVPLNCVALTLSAPKDLLSPPVWHYVLWDGDYLLFALLPGALGLVAIMRIRRSKGRLTGEAFAWIGVLASSVLFIPLCIKIWQLMA